MILTHKEVFLKILDPLRDVFNAFNPLGMLLRVLVFFSDWAFLSFLDIFLNFPSHFQPPRNLLWIFGIFFFFFAKLLVV